MPVGAAIGTAVVGIGGSVLSANAQKKATQQAAQAQSQSSAEQLALLKDLYGQNTANFAPYMNSGYGAQAVAEQLLGLKPLTATQFNNGEWYQPGTVNYSTPTPATSTPTPGTTGTPITTPTAANGYTGPSLSQIMGMAHDGQKSNGQSALQQYMSYYQQHPDQDPGFSGTQMFVNDGFKNSTALANGVLTAHQAYTSQHPNTGTGATNGTGGATAFTATPAGGASINPFADLIPQTRLS
jgi:type II secretory pathway pseudopilin PulG